METVKLADGRRAQADQEVRQVCVEGVGGQVGESFDG